ncbi:MAG: Brp/Blh family beta-carotene 15,15'-dioxygenase [Mycobacteriaceae bacterium]
MTGTADYGSGWPSTPAPAVGSFAVGPRVSSAPGPLGVAANWSRWLILGAVVIAGGQFAGLPAITGPVALVVAGLGFLLGVPHGAADQVVAARLSGGRPMVLIGVVYVCVAAAAWALMQWAGLIAVVMVVALSVLHFGLGELEVCRQLTGWRPGRVPSLAIAIAGSGALVLPLARSGDQLKGVAAAISPGLAPLLGGQPVQIGLVVIWLAAALVAVIASLRSGHPRVASDIVLVGALGALAPPLIAFAVWFGGWHAIRHCARMLTVEPGCAALVSTGRDQAAVLRLIRLAALPSIAAVAAVVALGWLTVTAPDPTVAVAEILRLLLALTVPHMMVVWWLDRTTDRGPGTASA